MRRINLAGLLLFTPALLGCGPAVPKSSTAPTGPVDSRAAYALVAPPVVTPVSPEAAAANKPRGDASLVSGDTLLRGSTAGVVILELAGAEMLERANVDLPGATSDLAMVGGMLLAAQGPAGLAVIDVSNPVEPAVVAWLDTPGGCVRLSVLKEQAVIAEGTLGLALLNVKKPKSPRVMAVWKGRDYVRHAALTTDHVYAADGRAGIAILERRGDNLVEVGRLEPGGDARALFIFEDRLFAALGGKGLAIYDLAVKARPALLTLVDVGDAARDVVADTRHAFVAGGDTGVAIVDYRAASPSVIGTHPTETPANRVRLDTNRLLVGADSSGLLLVDVTDRLHPKQTHPASDPD